jgi:hypothetical protein
MSSPLLLLLACGQDDPGDTGTTVADPVLTLVGDALPAALVSIWGTSASDVWTVGARDASGPLVYHWDGSAWTRLDMAGEVWDAWWVWGDGQGTVFISGSGAHMAKVDTASMAVTTSVIGDPAYTLFGTWGSGQSDVWSVGGDIAGPLPGGIFHYDGSSWTLNATATNDSTDGPRDAFKVWGRSANDVFVVGTRSLTQHWDGATWTDIDSPVDESVTLFTASGDSAGALAVGGQGNGQAQTMTATTATLAAPTPDLLAPGFLGVYDDDTTDPLVTGNNGTLWWYRSGTWERDARQPVTTRGLHAGWVDPDGGVWAVGGDLVNLDYGVIVYGGEAVPSSP